MLVLSQDYYNQPILSLRNGGEVGSANTPMINPNTLRIEGWYASAYREKEEYILPATEIREIIAKGFVVDDHTALTPIADMVRLRDTVNLRFEILNKHVTTESGKKLGKVGDYAVDGQSKYIKKLYVNPPILKGFTNGQVMIDRSAIVEITNRKIVVTDATVRQGSSAPVSAPA